MDVVVVNYRTPEHLLRCLASAPPALLRDIVVLDNCSGDDSARLVQREFPDVRVIVAEVNGGFGAGVRAALEWSNSPYVLVLNADTELVPETLDVLQKHLRDHPRCAVAGPRILSLDGSLQPSAFPWPSPVDYLLSEMRLFGMLRRLGLRSRVLLRLWDHDAPRTVPWVLGCAFAVRRRAYDQVGGFDAGYSMYFEETDLCARLTAAGWQTHFVPDALVRHVGGASTGQRRAEMRVQMYRSMARWYRLHRSRRSLLGLRVAVLLSLPPLTVKALWRACGHGSQDPQAIADLNAWRTVAADAAAGWSR